MHDHIKNTITWFCAAFRVRHARAERERRRGSTVGVKKSGKRGGDRGDCGWFGTCIRKGWIDVPLRPFWKMAHWGLSSNDLAGNSIGSAQHYGKIWHLNASCLCSIQILRLSDGMMRKNEVYEQGCMDWLDQLDRKRRFHADNFVSSREVCDLFFWRLAASEDVLKQD